jgi:hypothetical protein
MSRLFNTLEMDRDFKRSSQAFPNSYGPFTGAQELFFCVLEVNLM